MFFKAFSKFKGDEDMFKNILEHQLAFTCSKSTIETLEKDVKYVQS